MASEPLSVPKLRYSLQEASHACGLCPNTIAALEGRGEFPPRVAVPSVDGSPEGRKKQFIAREVEAWARGLDWPSLVAERLGPDWRRSA